MKKHFLFLLLITTTLTSFCQEVLFIGLYTKADASTSYWCRGMDMVKQIVKTEAEAQQLITDFKKEHDKESPITKIFKTSSVVLFDYIKDDNAFNCKYRVIGWKEGKNAEEARQTLEKDKDRIKKEYNGTPKELYAWEAKASEAKNELSFLLNGVAIKLTKLNAAEGAKSTWLANVTNPLKENAAYIVFLLDEVRYPSDFKKSFKLQPGETLNVNLGKGNDADVLVRLGKKDEEEEESKINQVKNYIRQKVKDNKGKLEIFGAPFSVRG